MLVSVWQSYSIIWYTTSTELMPAMWILLQDEEFRNYQIPASRLMLAPTGYNRTLSAANINYKLSPVTYLRAVLTDHLIWRNFFDLGYPTDPFRHLWSYNMNTVKKSSHYHLLCSTLKRKLLNIELFQSAQCTLAPQRLLLMRFVQAWRKSLLVRYATFIKLIFLQKRKCLFIERNCTNFKGIKTLT